MFVLGVTCVGVLVGFSDLSGFSCVRGVLLIC